MRSALSFSCGVAPSLLAELSPVNDHEDANEGNSGCGCTRRRCFKQVPHHKGAAKTSYQAKPTPHRSADDKHGVQQTLEN